MAQVLGEADVLGPPSEDPIVWVLAEVTHGAG